MDFEDDGGYGDGTGLIEKIGGFLDSHQWIFFVVFFVSFALFLLAMVLPEPVKEQQLGTLYDFNYGPVLVYKNVLNENSRHMEKILVSSAGGARDLSLFVLVPKELAQSSADIVLASNGRISILQPDPLYRIDAVNADSISVEFSADLKSGGENICSYLVVMHSAAVAQFTSGQLQSVIESIVAKDSPSFDCGTANTEEKELGSRLYKAATGE